MNVIFTKILDDDVKFAKTIIISRLKFDEITDRGKKKESYKVVLPFNINGHAYYYGHSTDTRIIGGDDQVSFHYGIETRHWFIQELNYDGKMEPKATNGT
ncbi:1266_t:CDS:2 [Diversispora eburnea]|uniref:1266_t:CDS:1 n=1 Tax=Diversispora eburnea TaxID=1213867 RepID=A0A9N9G9T2_9GLOM|nr:1266_t:CDS:2 [Diversispora eburnea]